MIGGRAQQTHVTWEPVVDLATGAVAGHRAVVVAPFCVASPDASAQALQAAITVSALPRPGRRLVVPIPVDDVASPAVTKLLALAGDGLRDVVVELTGPGADVCGPAARALRAAGAQVAVAGDIACALRTWDDVSAALREDADLGCGPVLGAPSAAFRGPGRAVVARVRWAADLVAVGPRFEAASPRRSSRGLARDLVPRGRR